MRGERRTHKTNTLNIDGSSPHARGTLSRMGAKPGERRFIPACAGNARSRQPGIWRSSVHPRMRGERYVNFDCELAARGSSPHARGTRCIRRPARGAGRFIPACAGNAIRAVEPRVNPYGSSPHARGTHRYIGIPSTRYRFIPACAGNALSTASQMAWCTVHPRMRGERRTHKTNTLNIDGSSPHARGTLSRMGAKPGERRFIPACAGNARSRQPGIWRSSVHPRMRGERYVNFDCELAARGSSPHARGTRCIRRPARGAGRFIPACAGNAIRAVEPRVNPYGSSPHARGTHRYIGIPSTRYRFIPACAGNALSTASQMAWCTVHPRMRGERFVNVCRSPAARGSSPHARGTPEYNPKNRAWSRFIPACAGNAVSILAIVAHVAVHPRMRGERH